MDQHEVDAELRRMAVDESVRANAHRLPALANRRAGIANASFTSNVIWIENEEGELEAVAHWVAGDIVGSAPI